MRAVIKRVRALPGCFPNPQVQLEHTDQPVQAMHPAFQEPAQPDQAAPRDSEAPQPPDRGSPTNPDAGYSE